MLRMAKRASKALGQPFSITVYPDVEAELRRVMQERNASMRGLMSKLAAWFVELDPTERALVLGDVSPEDHGPLLERVLQRRRVREDAERAGIAADAAAELQRLRDLESRKSKGRGA